MNQSVVTKPLWWLGGHIFFMIIYVYILNLTLCVLQDLVEHISNNSNKKKFLLNYSMAQQVPSFADNDNSFQLKYSKSPSFSK